MQIQTRNRKSATEGQPKGRARFALADRREAPFAAILAGLMIGMAAWVKSAFGAAAPSASEADGAPLGADAAAAGRADPGPAPLQPLSRPISPDMAEVPAPGELPAEETVADLGRIGRGPGALDLSRFFPQAEPALDLPALPGGAPAAGGQGARGPGPLPDSDAFPGAGAAPGPAAGPVGPGVVAGPGNAAGNGSGTGSGGDPAASDPGPIAFEQLFARLAQIVSPFGPETLRDIGNLAIGDWVSQHELRRLRGEETADPALAAFRLGEDRSHDLLSNPQSREAFLQAHFPTADPDAPPATALSGGDEGEAAGALTSLVPDSPTGLL